MTALSVPSWPRPETAQGRDISGPTNPRRTAGATSGVRSGSVGLFFALDRTSENRLKSLIRRVEATSGIEPECAVLQLWGLFEIARPDLLAQRVRQRHEMYASGKS
jgi:hypothetical protein